MSSTPPDVVPEDPQGQTWDVVIVGTGVGGATLGYALAKKGRKVLFLEKGHYLFGDHDRTVAHTKGSPTEPPRHVEVPENVRDRLDHGWWPHQLDAHVSRKHLKLYMPLGCGTGGSSTLYAAQLERLMPADFEPRRHHPQGKDSTLPEAWPFPYEELVPYYRKAEVLYTVCGTQDPLNPDPDSPIAVPPPASERDAFIMDEFARAGLHPYRAHVGCRYVPGCLDCGGVLCPKSCKADSGLVGLQPAVTEYGAKLLPDAEVTRLEAEADRVTGVRYRRAGVEATVRGRVVVLAAGSLMTPAILLKSGSDIHPNGLANRSSQVGRNLMMHASDFIAIRPKVKLSSEGPAKSVSFNDLYLKAGQKLGTFQTVGMAVSAGVINRYLKIQSEKAPKWYNPTGTLGKVTRKVASQFGAQMFSGATVFASIVEDLPYPNNRVVLDDRNPNGMRFEYDYPDELRARVFAYREALKRVIGPSLGALVLNSDQNLNYGHTVGTCRSGDDPETSVVDAHNRAHDLENLYVADGSWFPSSGGINPSLTIAANALRVAEAIDAKLD